MEVEAPQLSPHEVHRPVRSLLLLVVALLSVIGVNAPSAAAAGGPETRVRAIPTATAAAVGQQSSETAGGVGRLRPSHPAIASGSCVATEAADAARAAGKNGGAAAQLDVPGSRPFVDVSGSATPIHPQVQQVLDDVPVSVRKPWHGGCAEPRCEIGRAHV